MGDYLEQDGSRTGEKFSINSLCPFKATYGEGDQNHFPATKWLDCAVQEVTSQATEQDDLITAIAVEIERSVPLEPVKLTAEGDLLREYPSPHSGFIDHTRDDGELSSCVGLHKRCNGWVDRRDATETHDALSCRSCNMRVLFPKSVKTYGELREALAATFETTPV